MRLFVFGMGYSALAVMARLRPRLERVWGTSRSPDRLKAMMHHGVGPVFFDGTAPGDDVRAELHQATHVLHSIPPTAEGDPVLRFHGVDLATARPQAIAYLSTVGVYGDHGGDWVDETSACFAVSDRSRRRLEAEEHWRAFSAEHGIPVSIIRLAGIYGPGRGPLQKLRAGQSRRIIKPGQVFNRIHVDDIARIVEAALDQRADGVFNGSDDEPAPPQDVIAHAASLLGIDPPPEIALDDAELSEMARSFYGENKRVKNDRIKAELGIGLAHPTYREGLRAILDAEKTRRPDDAVP